jgi:hypothetical protein
MTSRSLIKLIAHVAVRREWRILVFGPPRDQRRGIQDGHLLLSGARLGLPWSCGQGWSFVPYGELKA